MKKQGKPEGREYQTRAVDELARLSKEKRRIVFVAPTGAGKTLMAVLMMLRMLAVGLRLLFLAHRRELIKQAADTLEWGGVPVSQISVLQASDPRYNPNCAVQIASVQTYATRERLPADVVFIDEGHRCGAETYRQILEDYPNALIVLLTATPVRGKRGLKGLADGMVIAAKPSELIRDGFIVAPEVLTVPTELMPDLSKVKTESTGDYNQTQLAEAMSKPAILGSIIDHYREYGGGQRAILFAVNVEKSKELCEMFNAAGVPAGHVDGSMGIEARQLVFDRLESGEILVLCNVDVCTEGWDMPSVRVCIMARPTKSLVITLQQSGRVMRPWGSEPSIIIDHVGNIQRFGLPDADRDWKLDSPPKRTMTDKTCPKCLRIVKAVVQRCPGWPAVGDAPARPCDHVWGQDDAEGEAKARTIEQVDGKLARAARDREPMTEEQLLWRDLCRVAHKQGYKENWARLQWKDRFGGWPSPEKYKFPERPESRWDDLRRRRKLDELKRTADRIGEPQSWASQKYETMFGEPISALIERERAAFESPQLPADTKLRDDEDKMVVDL